MLYRHFPTRDALIVAVYEDRIGSLSSLAGSHVGDPATWLLEWLDQLVDLISVDVGLRNPFSGGLLGAGGEAAIGRWRGMLLDVAKPLFVAAELDGAIRGGNGARARRLLRLVTND